MGRSTFLPMTKILVLICLISMSTCTIIPILEGLVNLFTLGLGGLGHDSSTSSHSTSNYHQTDSPPKKSQ